MNGPLDAVFNADYEFDIDLLKKLDFYVERSLFQKSERHAIRYRKSYSICELSC